jgi:putative oxidoreductase
MGLDLGLLLLRALVGLTLAAHGVQKLFGWFGGPGLEAAGAGFEKLGFVPGRRNALLAGLAEALGGVFLATGFATAGAAAVVLGVMLVAVVSAHLPKGFFGNKGGYEYPLVLGIVGLSLAFTGAGRLSVDSLTGWALAGIPSGLAALVSGAVGASLVLATRRRPSVEKA